MAAARQAWRAKRLFDGAEILNDRLVVAEDGVVSAMLPADATADCAVEDLPDDAVLAPGFIDIQVNGGGGVMLNDSLSAEGIATICAAHARFGTRFLLPTLISASRADIARAIAAAREAIAQGVPGVLGVHIEGPFINPARNGAHPLGNLLRPEPADIDLLASLGPTGVTLVTLAPEVVPPGFIRALVERGVRVCAGHSNASAEDMTRARAEGLSGVTHLFNAMSQLGSREPGMVGAAMSDPGLSAGIIADGHHVAWPSFQAAFRAIGPQRMMLVTDAMATIGARRDAFVLFGETIRAREGRLVNAEGRLAGAHLDMNTAILNAHRHGGATLAEALAMASTVPAAYLGLSDSHGRITPGRKAIFSVLRTAFRLPS
ncbi:MAG: N-acetylglucosamine-6-phosphate deacetylase [Bosea sp.]|uniref:N-acetylglucosamine-6-phosphate deacetylase n=1 Tax=Bosea sp. (in: a-proteobacteria) TaxID=1871050 RepID=UPI001AC22B1D|nr:N-acetylglucosamine-6-phosphate deacetylase [Bosea sp. (in: a-proteobacteria)]MBN9451462.1 N-acetylglucosamine-6-phosphate deacetylase [Bosea sp. (in: a-proteobacteria)]